MPEFGIVINFNPITSFFEGFSYILVIILNIIIELCLCKSDTLSANGYNSLGGETGLYCLNAGMSNLSILLSGEYCLSKLRDISLWSIGDGECFCDGFCFRDCT